MITKNIFSIRKHLGILINKIIDLSLRSAKTLLNNTSNVIVIFIGDEA